MWSDFDFKDLGQGKIRVDCPRIQYVGGLTRLRINQVLLVKGYQKGASWSFPRGKINKEEPEIDCAIREVGRTRSRIEASTHHRYGGIGS
jgi:ADP-ribose pyrophosphatase YjhB (NUDIX family)